MFLIHIIVLALIAVYIIALVYFRLESRVAIAMALTLLIATAITMVLGMEDLAEQLAIYTFYFLVAEVSLPFVQYIRGNSKRSE